MSHQILIELYDHQLQVDHKIIISWVREGEQTSQFPHLLRVLAGQVAGIKLSSVQHIIALSEPYLLQHKMINLHVGKETILGDSSLLLETEGGEVEEHLRLQLGAILCWRQTDRQVER